MCLSRSELGVCNWPESQNFVPYKFVEHLINHIINHKLNNNKLNTLNNHIINHKF